MSKDSKGWKAYCPACKVWRQVELEEQKCPKCGSETRHLVKNYPNSELEVG